MHTHDLLIAKLDAYGFDKETLSLICSYVKNRKLFVLSKLYINFLELLQGVPKESVSRVLHFNVFLNHLFITKAYFHNYADDNTFSTYASHLNSLIDILIEESQTTIMA